ncbi:MAG: helix-turn-helix transcriptional regulator [Rhizobiales bacterium]|nr:helix-turn-helix transcriptional regulator [Hyphomicrobiales bacterium]
MSASTKKKAGGCPIDYGLGIFGDRWTLLVIRDLLFAGKRHFKQLMESPERIASNILTVRLKKLEEKGLISRSPDPDNRKQVVYELTQKGLDLTPMLIELIRWSAAYDPNTAVPKPILDRIAKDRAGFIKDTITGARQGKHLLNRQQKK